MSTNKHINHKHLAHLAVVKKQEKIIQFSAIGIIAIVVLLVIYGYLSNTVLLPYRSVATVNGDKISVADFQKYVKLQRIQSINTYVQYYQYAQMFGVQDPENDPTFGQMLTDQKTRLTDTEVMGQAVVDILIEDRLVKQETDKRGITVSDEELDKYMKDSFGFFPDGTPTPAPTATMYSTNVPDPASFAIVTITPTASPEPTSAVEATATTEVIEPTVAVSGPTATEAPSATPVPTATEITADGYQTLLKDRIQGFATQTGIDEVGFKNLYRSYLLRDKLVKEVTADLKPFDEQVWARHILVKTEEEAKAVLTRLNAGEDWTKVSAEVSIDTGSKANGGDLGWFGKGMMVAPFEEAAFAMKIGEISQPVESSFGFHIIQLLGRQDKPLTETEFQTAKEKFFTEFLAKLKAEAKIDISDVWHTIIPTEPAAPF